MKIKSALVQRYESSLGLSTTNNRIEGTVALAVIGSMISFVITGLLAASPLNASMWWMLIGTFTWTVPYILGLIEIIVRCILWFGLMCCSRSRGVVGMIMSAIKGAKARSERKKADKLADKVFAGDLSNKRFEPFTTAETSITDKLTQDACLEVFCDQLGRNLAQGESVSVLRSEKYNDNEAFVLTSLSARSRVGNGHGANTDTFRCITIGLRIKLYPEKSLLLPELVMPFPSCIPLKQMWSIFHQTAEMRRQSEVTYNSIYDEQDPASSATDEALSDTAIKTRVTKATN